MAFGVALANATGETINAVTIRFTGEFWRQSTYTQNSHLFGYGSGSGTLLDSNYLTSSEMLADTRLDLDGPGTAATASALDGNLSANQISYDYTVSGLNWTAGDALFLRWTGSAGQSSGSLVGMDNFSITTAAVPEPSSSGVWFGCAVLVLAGGWRRRREQ